MTPTEVAGLITAVAGLQAVELAPLWRWHNSQVKDLIAQRDGALAREDAVLKLADRNQAVATGANRELRSALRDLRKQFDRHRSYDGER